MIGKDSKVSERVFNFSSGPAVLPVSVLEKARDELLNFEGCGMSVMEISHRSKEFDRIRARTEAGVRKNLNVPDDYAVLFLHGGASLQFAMIPMNLYEKGKPVDAIHTGTWSKYAIAEIKRIAPCRIIGSSEADKFLRLPALSGLERHDDASYVHMVSNNTICGTQWKEFPDFGRVPLVSDMSSDIFSRPIDVGRFGLIFAGAQKNAGPAGVCLVIMRKDLAERASKELPTMLQYRTHIENGSRYNTPPVFAIYMMGLVMDWIGRDGGVSALAVKNKEKAGLLYRAIDESGFYYCPVNKDDRSLMNVVFRHRGNSEALEKKFADDAEKAGLNGLKGHRSVGGLRASIYNAMPIEGVEALTGFMKEFARKNG